MTIIINVRLAYDIPTAVYTILGFFYDLVEAKGD